MKNRKEMKKTGIYLLAVAYILLLIAIFLLPSVRVSGYSITLNTVSEMEARIAPNARIINVLKATLASGSVFLMWRIYEGFVFHRVILVVFGLAFLLPVFINHIPDGNGIRFTTEEDIWHSYFPGSAVLSFIILTLSTPYISENPGARMISAFTGLSTLLLAVMMSEAEQFAGLWQRLMYLIIFGWMILSVIIHSKGIR